MLAVTLAAVVGGATTAVVMAAIPNSQTGEINACYRTQGGLLVQQGALRAIDAEAGQSCAGNETSLNWEQSFGQNHYKQLKFTIQPGGSETKPFVFPVSDAPVQAYIASSSVDVDCGGGAIETVLYGSYNAPVLFKDSRTGNLNIDENANPLNFVIWGNFGGGYCAGQVAGQVEFDDDNDVIIVSHNNSGSTIDLVSPAEITITFWY